MSNFWGPPAEPGVYLEDNYFIFSLLVFGSPEYRNLVKGFNAGKLRLEAERTRKYGGWARPMPNEQPATEDFSGSSV
jgi:hypothetical protein